MAKILLVEDDNNLREIYEARLQAEGYDIVAARDGEEALTVAMKERPDLIISDVMMPKISGFDMLDIIRSTEETKDAKVIMMTALSQAEDKERADKLGADRYLVKSQVTLEDVAKVAREVLNGESKTSTPVVDTPAPVAQPTEATQPTAAVLPQPAPPPADPAAAAITPVPEVSDTTAPITPVATPAVPAASTAAQPDPAAATPAPAPTVSEPAQPAGTAATDSTSTSTSAATTTSADETTDEPVKEEQEPPKVVASDSPALTAASPQPASLTEPPQSEQADTSTTENSTSSTPTQSVDDEKAAIAAQIEEFIESKKTSEAPPTVDIKTKKKVITPINDLNASSGPDLNSLLEKEAEKDKMASIAKQYAEKKILDDEEYDAETALKEAAENIQKGAAEEQAEPKASEETAAITTEGHAPEVKISDDGDLVLPAEESPQPAATTETPTEPSPESPEPAAEQTKTQSAVENPAPEQSRTEPEPEASTPTEGETPTDDPEASSPEPVIPHKNGTSIDGVVPSSSTAPSPDQQSAVKDEPAPSSSGDIDLSDPNSIAL